MFKTIVGAADCEILFVIRFLNTCWAILWQETRHECPISRLNQNNSPCTGSILPYSSFFYSETVLTFWISLVPVLYDIWCDLWKAMKCPAKVFWFYGTVDMSAIINFSGKYCFHFLPWRWRQYATPKCWYTSTRLYSDVYSHTMIFLSCVFDLEIHNIIMCRHCKILTKI